MDFGIRLLFHIFIFFQHLFVDGGILIAINQVQNIRPVEPDLKISHFHVYTPGFFVHLEKLKNVGIYFRFMEFFCISWYTQL